MSGFQSILEFFDSYLQSAVYFPFLLLGTGIFFTLYLGFPQIPAPRLGGQNKPRMSPKTDPGAFRSLQNENPKRCLI